jgi:hypothetical protein
MRAITHFRAGVDDPTDDTAPAVPPVLASNRVSVCATMGASLSDWTNST